jgi:hypothetical protein
MKDDLRPAGVVQVICSVAGCGWALWLDPLDPRLPAGPFDCGNDHAMEAAIDAALETQRARGWEWLVRKYRNNELCVVLFSSVSDPAVGAVVGPVHFSALATCEPEGLALATARQLFEEEGKELVL